MVLYTRTGDDGWTRLIGRRRVPKSDPRVEAYGSVDELNAWLGYVIAVGMADPWPDRLQQVQRDLFVIGAYLAADPDGPRPSPIPPPLDRIREMEQWIDACEADTGPMRSFILPGGHLTGAALHIARTVCRRAERRIVVLRRTSPVPDWILTYMNRLSDLLFALARWANAHAGVPDIPWHPPAPPTP